MEFLALPLMPVLFHLLGKALRSTAWRTVSAATKASIADAFANGQFDRVASLLGKAGLAGQAATAAEGE
jgi:hypothetical protein